LAVGRYPETLEPGKRIIESDFDSGVRREERMAGDAPYCFDSSRYYSSADRPSLKRPVVARIATITEWPLILIDLLTEEGVVGRSYLEPYIVNSMRYLVPALHDLGALFKGRQVAPIELFDAARKSLHFVGYEGLSMIAAAGLDMASWDALAKLRISLSA
jgi:Mandelate racemase / muconate lactonizing enzyme, N-terminal domain